jgi:hypothetical protein
MPGSYLLRQSHYVAQTDLAFTFLLPQLSGAGITGLAHHTQLEIYFLLKKIDKRES